MLVCLVGRTHEWTTFYMNKTEVSTNGFIFFELIRTDKILHGQVGFARLKILTNGDHIHLRFF